MDRVKDTTSAPSPSMKTIRALASAPMKVVPSADTLKSVAAAPLVIVPSMGTLRTVAQSPMKVVPSAQTVKSIATVPMVLIPSMDTVKAVAAAPMRVVPSAQTVKTVATSPMVIVPSINTVKNVASAPLQMVPNAQTVKTVASAPLMVIPSMDTVKTVASSSLRVVPSARTAKTVATAPLILVPSTQTVKTVIAAPVQLIARPFSDKDFISDSEETIVEPSPPTDETALPRRFKRLAATSKFWKSKSANFEGGCNSSDIVVIPFPPEDPITESTSRPESLKTAVNSDRETDTETVSDQYRLSGRMAKLYCFDIRLQIFKGEMEKLERSVENGEPYTKTGLALALVDKLRTDCQELKRSMDEFGLDEVHIPSPFLDINV